MSRSLSLKITFGFISNINSRVNLRFQIYLQWKVRWLGYQKVPMDSSLIISIIGYCRMQRCLIQQRCLLVERGTFGAIALACCYDHTSSITYFCNAILVARTHSGHTLDNAKVIEAIFTAFGLYQKQIGKAPEVLLSSA